MLAAGCGGEPTASPVSEHQREVARIETVMERCFRGDPIARAHSSVSNVVARFNDWVQQSQVEFEKTRTDLEKRADTIETLSRSIKELDEQLASPAPAGDPAYAARVQKRNGLVREYNSTLKQHNADAETLNESLTQFRAEAERRRKQIGAARKEADAHIEEYRRWLKTRQDLAFFHGVNRLYAKLLKAQRTETKDAQREAGIAKLRDVRAELGRRAIRETDPKEGLILVHAKITGPAATEECVMIVDTGAETVTVDPPLVQVLGLEDRLGDEVQAAVAGGLTTKGREIVIPAITVSGETVRDTDSVALKAPDVGIDGIVGLSFLNRFEYRIDRSDPRKLILQPKAGGSR